MLSRLSGDYELCEIKEISPAYRLFAEYKSQELMLTIVFFLTLMYMEEFLFAFQFLLVRTGLARPLIVRTTIFPIVDRSSTDSESRNTSTINNNNNKTKTHR